MISVFLLSLRDSFSHPDPFLVGYAGNWSPDGTLYDPPTCEAAVGTLY